jgi:flagellar motor switch protein FliN
VIHDVQASLIALADELAAALGNLAGGQADMTAGAASQERCWIARLTTPEGNGEYVVAIGCAGAEALSRLVSGADADAAIEDASIADLLRNGVTQAAAAMALRPEGEGIELSLSALEPAQVPASEADGVLRTVTLAGIATPISIAVRWVQTPHDEAAAEGREPSDDRLGSRIDVILDIDLPVIVRFGHTELPIRALSRIGPGSVIDLGRSPDDPVEVLVSNRVVARGEVVIVGGNYGVRILDVTSQSERVRSMET